MMAESPNWLVHLLNEQSFIYYHAFCKTNFHNHKAHSIVALARVGASEERVKEHCHWQNKKGGITSFRKERNLSLGIEVDSIKSDKISDYLGKNVGFYRILDHFTRLYCHKFHKNIKKLLKSELPELIDGPLGSLYHGIIQLGYGYAAGCDRVVLEGLALCFQQFTLVRAPKTDKARDISGFGRRTADFLDILSEIRENKTDKLRGFQMAEEYGDLFIEYTDRIRLPHWYVSDKKDISQAVRLADWLLDMAAVVYVKCEYVSDYILLHAISGAWALKQIIELLDYDVALRAIRAHLTAFLIMYAVLQTPKLTRHAEDYWKGDTISKDDWAKILTQLKEKGKEYDTHVYQVVQCLYEAWMNDPQGRFAKYYIAGAIVALNNDMHHIVHGSFPRILR